MHKIYTQAIAYVAEKLKLTEKMFLATNTRWDFIFTWIIENRKERDLNNCMSSRDYLKGKLLIDDQVNWMEILNRFSMDNKFSVKYDTFGAVAGSIPARKKYKYSIIFFNLNTESYFVF